MKVAFVSNFFSHHQEPFADAMNRMENVQFNFVATQPISEERLKMGWRDSEKEYIVYAYRSGDGKAHAMDLTFNADVTIIGSAPDEYIIPRLRKKKLTFRYSERFYKQGLNSQNIFHETGKALLHHSRFQAYPLYMLCASAYTAADAAIFHNYINRTYKWGYFVEAKHYDFVDLMDKKQGLKHPRASILWAGRLIGWKHPDASIHLAETLKRQGYQFKLTIIGSGAMEQDLHRMISEKGLEDCVEMLGAMSSERVREYMEKADIFLFTSDFNEGWGAVLNESMNSGCAVVASHAIGAVPYLMRHKENGLIYHSGNVDELYENVKYLLDNPAEQERLGRAAYETIVGEWNAETAAERLVALSQRILDGDKQPDLFETGPCSRAEIIENDWFHL